MSEPAQPAPVPASVRAQLLATEHWSLLATRSQTWSEVMSRIMAQFTFTSAVLVVLALVVQNDGPFRALADPLDMPVTALALPWKTMDASPGWSLSTPVSVSAVWKFRKKSKAIGAMT